MHLRRTLFLLTAFLIAPIALPASPTDGLPALDEELDRSTPVRSMRLFLDLCRENDYVAAAHLMDLRGIPRDKRAEQGPRLARQLKFVLDQTLWIDYETISDAPEGAEEDGANIDTIGEIEMGRATVPFTLSRVYVYDQSVTEATGEPGFVWVVSGRVVQQIPDLYRVHGAGWAPRVLPEIFFEYRVWEIYLWQFLGLILVVPLGLALGWLLSFPVLYISRFFYRRTSYEWDDILFDAARPPLRLFLALLFINIAFNYLKFSVPVRESLTGFVQAGFIFSVAWLITRFVNMAADSLRKRLAEDEDSLEARGARTQLIVLRRVINIAVYMIAGALMLTQFAILRKIGMSLLASAGVAGVVIGLAAQKSISNLLAGIQLAMTQPIRIGDTVIVEGEWGWIEEINLTYVVVKVWDLRRLVVPIQRFLDTPFQNWTKVSPDILGTIFFYADYTVPVETLREELKRFVSKHPLWNGVAAGLLVTDAKENVVQLRALVSADDAGKQWDLRCAVREHMVQYLQDLEGGRYLPKTRVTGNLSEGNSE